MRKIPIIMISVLLAITISGVVSAVPTADIEVNQWTANSTDVAWMNETNATYHGDNVAFIVAVKNKGTDTVSDVVVNNTLPQGLTPITWYISLDNYKTWLVNDTSYNPTTGLWTIAQLKPNQRVYLNYAVSISNTGNILDTVKRVDTGNYIDPNPLNDQKTVTINVPAAADIAVTSSAPSTPNFGDTVTITINAKNNGPNTATGVKITSILPAGLKFISSNGDYNATTGVWNVGTVANGATSTLNILAQVTGTSGILNVVSNKTAENEYDYNVTNDLNTTALTITLGNQVTFTDVDDGNSGQLTLPFTVNLFGRSYNRFYINVNGLVSFNSAISDYKPNPSKNAYVAAFWDDIYLTAGGAVYYRVTDNMVTVTWVKVPSYLNRNNPTLFNTFQIRIVRNATTGATTYSFVYGDMQWKIGYSGGSSFAGFGGYRTSQQSSHTYTTFWTSSSPLTQIAYQTFWFSSVGELIT